MKEDPAEKKFKIMKKKFKEKQENANKKNYVKACKEIIKELIKEKKWNEKIILKIKKKTAKKYKLMLPRNSDLIKFVPKKEKKLFDALKKTPIRSSSGVTVIAVMTQPKKCPGKCVYCPNSNKAPKSYTGYEPAALRARNNNFSPEKQVINRLNQLKETGHSTEKNEVIIMGGTFPALSWNYQKAFVKRIFEALNKRKSKNLKEAQKKNEKTKNKCIGLTIETRPDYCNEKEINRMLELGVTRVELGVQSIKEKILKESNRMHGVKEIINATKLLKDNGLKVCYHFMLGLPKSNPKKDLKQLKELFENSCFRPDMLKLYPCIVVKESKLYKEFKKGNYKAYDEKKLIKLLTEIKKIIPEYVRIMRIQRDIPSDRIINGSKKSNLREIVQEKLKEQGIKCNCIRCREIRRKKEKIKLNKLKLKKIKYEASNGIEYFLQETDNENNLYGFLRLRIPGKKVFRKELKKTGIVRELHVLGESIAIGKKEDKVQHKGIGSKLLKEAEKITRKQGLKKLAVISGIGVREYYRKKGYKLKGSYMIKELK